MLDVNDKIIAEAKKILTEEEVKVIESWDPNSNLGRATKMQIACQIYTAAMLRKTQNEFAESNRKNEARMLTLTWILALAAGASVIVEIVSLCLGR